MKPMERKILNAAKLRELLFPLTYSSGFGTVVRNEAFVNLRAEFVAQRRELEQIKTALAEVGNLLTFKFTKESVDAISEGKEQGSSIEEHLNGDEGREAAEASYRDSGVRSRKRSTEEVTPLKESPGTLIQELNEGRASWSEETQRFAPAPYSFMVTDQSLVADLGNKSNNYKWDPQFNYAKGPYLPPDDDQSSKERFFAGNFKVVSSCE